ncbi:MAG: hypothetical protein K6T88_07785 [Bacillus sp. (in: Bacteria)]|nr:hypothetical protein [Bacillus sp. (in: firmicutes)]
MRSLGTEIGKKERKWSLIEPIDDKNEYRRGKMSPMWVIVEKIFPPHLLWLMNPSHINRRGRPSLEILPKKGV